MVYPKSPFSGNFEPEFLQSGIIHSNLETKQLLINDTLHWLCNTPKYSSYRVNTLTHSVNEVLELIKNEVSAVAKLHSREVPDVYVHSTLKDVIIIPNWKTRDLDCVEKKVIVDAKCGEAVLRGSHIFAPGVLGMSNGIEADQEVGIYVDIEKRCKKGATDFTGLKTELIAIGVVKMTRNQLFKQCVESGVAIEIVSSKYGCIPLHSNFLPPGSALLQNIPSIVCAYVLNPKPGETILDMCAAPGNKTTHLAALMKNQGTLVALDKQTVKVDQLTAQCKMYKVNALAFKADSTKICCENSVGKLAEGPPFGQELFDRILLDAPCSALGKRPQLSNVSTKKMLESHIPVQRKLFETAIQLLKPNGVLVYSTCSIALAENEALVAWALHKFSNFILEPCNPHLGGPGLQCSGLSKQDCAKLQRFDNNDNTDSIGFFIARFRKK